MIADTSALLAPVTTDAPRNYTATYRRSTRVMSAVLLALAFLTALVAWAVTSVRDADAILPVFLFGAGGTILLMIAALLTALRVHHWVIEDGGLRIEERPKVPFTGLTKRAVAPWAEIVALRRIESGFERQIEIELRDGAVHRMAAAILLRPGVRSPITDDTGLDALAAAISARLPTRGSATSRIEEGLSFWNRLPGLSMLGVAFVGSVVVASLAVIAIWSGAYVYGAALKGTALILLLPVGAGYLFFKSLRRRLHVLNRAVAAHHPGGL